MLGLHSFETSDRGFQLSSGGYHWLVQEDTLSSLLVCSGFQRSEEMLRI
jgi:hypothetical protein